MLLNSPLAHPLKSICLSNTGDVFFTRFQHLGDSEPSDLEDAISSHGDALDHTHDHPDDLFALIIWASPLSLGSSASQTLVA